MTSRSAGSEDPIDVRPAWPHEWPEVRRIRLEALRDTPSAFVTTYDEAAAYPDELWIDRARAGALGITQLTMLAFATGGRSVALAIGLLKRKGTVLVVVSVYISPEFRGLGIGERMFTKLEDWGRSKGAEVAGLWVEETNQRALGFYRKIGFNRTDDRQLIPNDSGLWECRMEKDL